MRPSPRRALPYALHVLKLLPWTLFLPMCLVFFTEMNGPTVHEAAVNGIRAVASYPDSLLTWGSVLLANLLVFLYLRPVGECACAAEEGEGHPAGCGFAAAERRMDLLGPFAIGVWILVLFASAMARPGLSERARLFASPKAYSLLESCANGLMIGVLVYFNVENVLFPIRRLALSADPSIQPRKTSLYRRIALVIAAIVIFMVFQIFSSTTTFFQLGARHFGMFKQGLDRLSELERSSLAPEEALGIKEGLEVFFLRMAAFMFFIGQLMYQVRSMILKPLGLIKGKLADLNAEEATRSGLIQIINNDEFAGIYREVNRLIARQRGELEASRLQFDSVASSAADPILVYGEDLRITSFNPAAEAYFGYSEAEARGRPITDFIDLPCDPAGCADDAATDAAAADDGAAAGGDRRPAFRRLEGRAKDGGRLNFEAHSARSGDGAAATYTVILRDLSHQLRIEESLREAKRAAEEASRQKSEFLANMSHELRTPLNAVLGFAQLLAPDKNLTEGQREKIEVISRSGEHLLALINDILDLSKIEAGKSELRVEAFDLERFVDDLRGMFELRCGKKGLSLYVERVGELPRYVSGDLGKLRQVMINIVGNAVKFTAEGGVGLAVGRDGERIRFSVTDSGRGIPAGELASILQPFVQSSITDNEGGTGLGLAISSSFVRMMGGELEVKSEVGKGSVFSFSVPLPETSERPAEEAGPALGRVRLKAGRRATVLVVDDKETNRLVLKEMLEAAGFGTLEASDGREAVDLALERAPDLVFMDIKMPRMDGYEAVAELRRRAPAPGPKVFALTASAFLHDEERILASGFDGFLAKPFKRSALFALIRDKAGIELEYDEAGPAAAEPVPALGDLDLAAARESLGEVGIGRLEGYAAINDFAAARALADDQAGRDPALAAHLRRCADGFDEEGLAALVAALRGRS